MFTQLFITTGLVIVPIFFLITTLRLSLKTMNFISPDSKERVEHSGLFLKGVFKITIGLIVLLSAIIFYVLGITFMTKELIFLAFAMNVFIMTCGLLSSMAYFILPTVSNLELRISNIKHIQYTPEKKEIFNQTKKSIILSSVLTIIFHIILLGLDVFFIQKTGMFLSLLLFIVSLSVYIVQAKSMMFKIKRLDSNILSDIKGYLSEEELLELKKNYKESNTFEKDLVDAKNKKLKDLKNKNKK